MRNRTKMLILLGLAVISILLYVFYGLNGNYHYAFPRRLIKVVAMSLTGIAIAYSTVVFQTITHNRILTPSVMGLDALYMMVQTFIFYFFGSMSIFVINAKYNFLLAVLAMVVFAVIFYRVLFKEGKRPIYFLLLVGMIVGTFLGSVTTFFQVLIDPNEFLSLQSKMFASFNNVNSDLVWLAGVVIIITFIYGWRHMNQLDVMSLGRDTAINLGVPYDKLVQRMLILSSVLIAVSTALVGPITFFGLIVANLSYQFFKTYKHSVIIAGSCVMSIVALVGGQWIVERVFNFDTTLSVIINFVGGVYFIYLLLKESRSAG
ncbi:MULTISPECIES: iron chelate uptake ABC transporter family permease subunit [unclassified Lysinibacillus]|uniref:iron chelate uptake ABC transporter family permease subunit n=1 Tax=unclassified Lysinibacillus TaxID=2636778 RepID=UPI0035E19217